MPQSLFRVSLLVVLLASVALPQDGGPDPAKVIDRYQAYLARSPFKERGFDMMVDAAVSVNGLGDLVAVYELRVAEADAGVAERVVLARLYARTERADEALALLDDVTPESAELLRLRGVLLLSLSRVEDGLAALDAAVGLSEDRDVLEELHVRRGEARLAAGQAEAARAAFAELVALDPGDARLRSDAADALARSGLTDAALEEYAAAAVLVEGDAARLCRVLSELGRLQERLDRRDEALATYARATGLLGRGHWLRRDLEERVISIHRRGGSLPAFVGEVRAQLAAEPRDLATRELLARTLVDLKELDAARDVLVVGTRDFPQDLALARKHLDVLELLGDTDARVAEYQRVLAEHPDELELVIELGQVFASDGRLEQARLQWERSLEERLQDPSLCLRLAGLHALYDMPEAATELVERAIALQPEELGHYAELASLLVRRDLRTEVAGVLDRAERAAGDDPLRLETLADLARGHRDLERAERALVRARVGREDDPRLARALASVLVERDDPVRAGEVLRALVANAPDATTRRDAADRLVRLHRRSGTLDDLVTELEASVAADGDDLGARYLAAAVARRRGEDEQARGHLERIVELAPEDEAAREMFAALLHDGGNDAGAIAHYVALIELRPRSRARYLKEIARIHVDEKREDDAVACYEEVLELSPDNPATFREVARSFTAIGRNEEAAECLRQAARLRPDDGDVRMQLAEVYELLDDLERAEREVLLAAATDDESVVSRARGWLYERMVDAGTVDQEIADLRAALRANPYDEEKPLVLVDLFTRELEYELALDVIAELLAFRPADATLLRHRARLSKDMERWEDALDDYHTLQKLPGGESDELRFELAACYLNLGDRLAADKLLLQTGDLQRTASLYQRAGLVEEARATLEKALALAPDDRQVLLRLVSLHQDRRDFDAARAAYERIIALDGETFEHLKRLATLAHRAGRMDDFNATCLRMFAIVEPIREPEGGTKKERRSALRRSRSRAGAHLREIQEFMYTLNLWEAYGEVVHQALRANPTHPILIEQGLNELSSNRRGKEALELLAIVRAATLDVGRAPAGYDEASWTKYLDVRERNIYRSDPELGAMRAAELGTEEALSEDQIKELMELYKRQEQTDELVVLLERAVVQYPANRKYLGGLAISLVEERRFEEAEGALRELLELTRASSITRREPRVSRSYARNLERRMPPELFARKTDELLATHHRLGVRASGRESWVVGSTPRLDDVSLQLAWCLVELGRDAEAREILATFEPAHPELVQVAAQMAGIYRNLGWEADAERMEDGVWAVVEQVAAEPFLQFRRNWSPAIAGVVEVRLDELEKRGEDVARLWELRRRWQGHARAEALIVRLDARDEVTAAREAAWRAALAAAPQGPVPTLRDEGLLAAELLVAAERFDDAAAIYRELFTREPEDRVLLDALARLEERAGRRAEALALYQAGIEAARAKVIESGKLPTLSRPAWSDEEQRPDPYELVPTLPSAPSRNADLYSELAEAGMFSAAGQTKLEDWQPWDLLTAVFRLHWEAREWQEAGAVLESMVKCNPNVLGWVGWQLTSALDKEEPGGAALDIYRFLYDSNSNDDDSVEAYGRALVDVGREEDAKRVYKKYLRGRKPSPHDSVVKALARLEPPADAPGALELPADLAGAVEADPKNVRLRTALVRKLLDAGEDEAALVHALEAERIAPHLEDVRELARTTLLVAGRDDEYLERLRDAAQRTTNDDQRLAHAVGLARILRERGEDDAARDAIIDGMRAQSANYTAAGFFLESGRLDEARAQLERELEKLMGKGSWETQQVRASIARIAALQGDPLPLLDHAWEEAGRSGARAIDWNLLEKLVDGVRRTSDARAAAARVEAAAKGFDERRARVYRFVAERARNGHVATEAQLLEFGLSEPSLRELATAAVFEARARGDREAAERYLTTIAERVPISERKRVDSSLGLISEQQSMLTERGTLRQLAGDPGGARALWEEAFEGDSKGAWHLARLYAEHGRYADARREFERWTAQRTRKEPDEALLAAALLAHEGLHDEALAQLEIARLESERDAPDRAGALLDELAEQHRAAGRLGAWRERVQRMRDEDPGDTNLAARLLALVEELDGAAAADDVLLAWGLEDEDFTGLVQNRALAATQREDHERAAALYAVCEECRPNGSGWRIDGQRAASLWKAGRTDDALQAIRDAQDDPESKEALLALARFLIDRSRPEEALEHASRAAALGDSGWASVDLQVRALDKLDRKEEGLELLLDHLLEAGSDRSGGGWIRRLAGSRPVLADAEAALAAAPDDAGLRARVALLAYYLDQPARAAELLEALRAEDPGHALSGSLLWRAYRDAERYADALAELEALLDRSDRTRALGRGPSSSTDMWRRERGLLVLRLHGPERAAAAWSDSLGRRHAPVETGRMRHYQLFRQNRPELDLLWSYGLWSEFRAASATPTAPDRDPDPSRVHVAAFRMGDVDRALDGVWNDRGTPRWRPITALHLYYEAGRLDELEARVTAAPPSAELDDLMERVDELRGRWTRRLELRRAARGGAQPSERELFDDADLARRAGDVADAWSSIERALALRESPGASELPWFRRAGASGETTFEFSRGESGVDQLGSLGYVTASVGMTFSLSSHATHTELRVAGPTSDEGLAAALAWRSGNDARAAELEREDLERLTRRDDSRPERSLAAIYGRLGALDAAERLYLASLASHPGDELTVVRALTRLFHWSGATERRDTYAARWLAAHTAQPESVGRLWERAGFRAVYAQDLDAARAELARAAELDPDGAQQPARMTRAWTLLRLGRAEEALALFREQAKSDLWAGKLQRPSADLLYGEAQALLAVEGPNAAAPALRRAIANHPDDVRAQAARAALGE